MPRTQLQTTTLSNSIYSGYSAIVQTGTRLWACPAGGTDVTDPGICLWYSDDAGVTWTKHSQAMSGTAFAGTLVAYQDSGSVWHLHFFGSAGNSSTGLLRHRAIHTNVAVGTPGALTTALTIDAGGTDLGVANAHAFVTNTATNPRIWVVARKVTALGVYETRIWYCATGVAADTLANWTSINNAGNNSGSDTAKFGVGVSWLVGGVPKATVVCQNPAATPDVFKSFTFDPTAAVPALGSETSVAAISSGAFLSTAEQPLFTIAAKNDYLVFGRQDPQDATDDWAFYKTVNGTTWTTPTGWDNLTMGRAALASSPADIWMLHTSAYGALASTEFALSYRKINTATDTLGAPSVFSNINGNPLALFATDSTLYGIYRSGTASPYTISTDSVFVSSVSTTLVPASESDSLQAMVSRQAWTVDAAIEVDAVDFIEYTISTNAMIVLPTRVAVENRLLSATLEPSPTFASGLSTVNETSADLSGSLTSVDILTSTE